MTPLEISALCIVYTSPVEEYPDHDHFIIMVDLLIDKGFIKKGDDGSYHTTPKADALIEAFRHATITTKYEVTLKSDGETRKE